MSIRTRRELETTREKLSLLEGRRKSLEQQSGADPRVRELTLRSLQSLIKRLREEIARYEARTAMKG